MTNREGSIIMTIHIPGGRNSGMRVARANGARADPVDRFSNGKE